MLTKRSIVFLGLLLTVGGCGRDNPLAPSAVLPPTTSTSSSVESTSPVPPTLDARPIDSPPVSDPSDDPPAAPPRYTVEGPGACSEMGRHTWTLTVRDAGDRLRGASFFSPEAGCGPTERYADGSLRMLEENLPGVNIWEWNGGKRDNTGELCGRYQADIAIGRDGSYETIVGAVINTGRNCELDPPAAPPTCEELGNCEPPTCEEDPSQERCPPPTCEELGNCEPPTCEEDPSQERCAPPTCEELNPPAFDANQLRYDRHNIRAGATVSNNGTWVLSLYAGDAPGRPRYTKDRDDATASCGERDELSVRYGWRGHPVCYWWSELTLNGDVVFTSDVVNKCGN